MPVVTVGAKMKKQKESKMNNWEIEQKIKRLHQAQENGPGWQATVEQLRAQLLQVATRLELFADWKPWSKPAQAGLATANSIRWALIPNERGAR